MPQTSPKDVFLHLLSVITLYVSAIGFGSLVFDEINLLFPSPLDYGLPYDSMRWSLALLVILVPVYMLVTRYLYRDLAAHPEKKELRIRKWLIYLTLFVAALVIIGDLVSLVYTFLQGDFTIRFFLKIASVFLIAGTIFTYYLWDLRINNNE